MMMALCALTTQTAAADPILADAGNACPANHEKITSNRQCKLAEDYRGKENDDTWPSGCYFCDGVEDCEDGTWFNKHSTGSAHGGARPWCTAGYAIPPATLPSAPGTCFFQRVLYLDLLRPT